MWEEPRIHSQSAINGQRIDDITTNPPFPPFPMQTNLISSSSTHDFLNDIYDSSIHPGASPNVTVSENNDRGDVMVGVFGKAKRTAS